MSISKISIVIPVYNSRQSLQELVDKINGSLSEVSIEHEIIMVNDASPDDAWDEILRLQKLNSNIVGINLMRNFGQHNALICGIRNAKFPVIVTMDDDLQHSPRQIPKLLEKLTDKIDVVYGYPKKEQQSFFRNIASRLVKASLRIAMGVKIANRVSAFRAFRTELRSAFEDYSNPSVNLDVLLTWATTRFTWVEISIDQRRYGRSNYSVRKLISHSINMLTGFSIGPLRIASILGLVIAVFGAVLLTYVLVMVFYTGSSVPGFAFLATSITLFSGVQLFSLGIIGEYLGRLYFRSMNKPIYTIKSATVNSSSSCSLEHK